MGVPEDDLTEAACAGPWLPLSAAVLAGGASRRMGRDKAILSLGPGEPPVIARVLAAVATVTDDVVVVSPHRPGYRELGVRVVPDRQPGLGPLGGIATALEIARHEHCLIVSCDLPFLDPRVLAWLATHRRDYELLLPVVRSGIDPQADATPRPQPLHAVYARSCLATVRARIAVGDLRLASIAERVRTKTVTEADLAGIPNGLGSFFNMNTPADANQAAAWLESASRDHPAG
jgi:molybdopterin-guanine dinucleotide biosynthesis protein A